MVRPAPWMWALAASVAGHAAVFGLVWKARPVPAAAPLEAPMAKPETWFRVGVVTSAANSSPSAGGAPEPSAPVRRASPTVSSREVSAVVPADLRPAAATDPAELTGAADPAGGGAASDAGVGTGGVDGSNGDEGAAPGSGEGREAVGAGPSEEEVVALVHARLRAAADRCYPLAARRFQQTGVVQVSFCLDAEGALGRPEVERSSGAPLLDGAARDCVLPQARPFPPVAAGRCFHVPVRFGAAGR